MTIERPGITSFSRTSGEATEKGDFVMPSPNMSVSTVARKTRFYLIHPLYHYRLGRVYEDKGDKTKAAGQYQKFLDCWKDADSKHPELADAKKRLESLQPQAN
jgi:hypothetical protein